MSISRRKFLRRSSVLSLGALIPLSFTAQSKTLSQGWADEDLSKRLTAESFSANLKTTFQVHVSALNIQSVELTRVSTGQRFVGGGLFKVVFQGRGEEPFPQGTYLFEHDKMGTFPMFVVPVGGERENARYEAVFCRLHRVG